MTVEQIMSKKAHSCRPTDRLSDTVGILASHDFGCIPVVQEGLGVIGMITDRDICLAAGKRKKPLSEMSVSDAMTRDVRCCNRADTLSAAQEIMRTHQVRRLPVVDESNQLVGLLSLNDIAREAVRGGPSARGQVTREDVADTLAAICAPRVPAMVAG